MHEHLGEMAALATAVLWTLSALAWTAAGRHIGALAVSFLRLIMAIGALMLYGYLTRGQAVPVDAEQRTWCVLGISGFLGFFVSDLCLFQAFLLIGPRLALLVTSLTPPFTALFAWAYRGVGLGPRSWLGMAITLAGVAWVVMEERTDEDDAHSRAALRRGLVLAFIATVVQSAAMVLRKVGSSKLVPDAEVHNLTPDAEALILILGAMVGYLAWITLFGRWPAMIKAARHRRAAMILAGGTLVGPCLGVSMLMIAMKHIHEGVITTILATIPIMILPFSIYMFRERVSPRAWCGAVVAAAGVAVLMWP